MTAIITRGVTGDGNLFSVISYKDAVCSVIRNGVASNGMSGIGNTNRGIDVGSYPLARAVTFGLNLSY